MFKKLALVTLLALAPSVVLAQDAPPPMGGGGGSTFHADGKKLIFFGLPAGGGASAGLGLFLSDTTALVLDFVSSGLFSLGKGGGTGPASDETVLAFDFTLGYRMYRWASGDTATFLEPAISLGSNTSDFGANLHIGVGVVWGVEHKFADRFSLSGAVGVGLALTDEFESFELFTFSTGLFANFYVD